MKRDVGTMVDMIARAKMAPGNGVKHPDLGNVHHLHAFLVGHETLGDEPPPFPAWEGPDPSVGDLVDKLGLSWEDADPIRCAANAAVSDAGAQGLLVGWTLAKEIGRVDLNPREEAALQLQDDLVHIERTLAEALHAIQHALRWPDEEIGTHMLQEAARGLSTVYRVVRDATGMLDA